MMVSLPCCQDCAAPVGRLHSGDCPRRSAYSLRAAIGDACSIAPPLAERLAPYLQPIAAAPADVVDARLRAQESPHFALFERLLLGRFARGEGPSGGEGS